MRNVVIETEWCVRERERERSEAVVEREKRENKREKGSEREFFLHGRESLS